MTARRALALALAAPACTLVVPFGDFALRRDAPADDPADVAEGADVAADLADAADAPGDAGPDDVLDVADAADATDTTDAMDAMDACPPGLVTCAVASSCEAHLAAGRRADGFYLVAPESTPGPVRVECLMSLGGWARVLRVDAADACPAPLRQVAAERVCVRPMSAGGSVASLTVASPVPVRAVRGRAVLRGFGDVDAFSNGTSNRWDAFYVDGLTVSVLEPADGAAARRHVWTWALAGEPAARAGMVGSPCPCAGGAPPVMEVGASYLCAPTVPPGTAAASRFTWHDVLPGGWYGPGVAGVCAMAMPDGAFERPVTASSPVTLEVRVVLSGSSFNEGASGEDVGIRELDLLVR